MTSHYAQQRILEALQQAKGNKVRANQIIMRWASEDPKLLLALAKPHLGGIVAYNIDRVASGRAKKAQPQMRQQATTQADSPFGKDLLKAVADTSSAVFGLEGHAAPRKAGQASQNHINAIHRIASYSKKK